MSVTVRVPPQWRTQTDRQADVEVEGATVQQALMGLGERWPALRQRLFREDGKLAPGLAVFVNQVSISRLQGPETPLADRDRVMILLSMAGG